jgi:hypothetical protein
MPTRTRWPARLLRALPPLEQCDTPLHQSLWALKAAKLSKGYAEFITASVMSEILLLADVSLSPLRILRAMARSGDSVARRGEGRETEFRIVAQGERALEKGAGSHGPLALRISGAAPWSDRRFVVREAIKKACGEVRILDKYFGMESLDFLQGFQRNRRIRFLTSHPPKNLGHLQREVARFKKEFPNSEFKAYPSPQELHDRYVLFDDEIWFVGHGIKNLGEKESFVVILGDHFGKDIRSVLTASFDKRWGASPDF